MTMRHITLILCLLVAGCNKQNESVKVNVPDTVRVCDTVRIIDSTLERLRIADKLWIIRGEDIQPLKGQFAVKVYWYDPAIKKRIESDDGYMWMGNPWPVYDAKDCYQDSLSACRALHERLEKQRNDIEKKMKGLCK